jgi:hypothetical protein
MLKFWATKDLHFFKEDFAGLLKMVTFVTVSNKTNFCERVKSLWL